jgi:NTE family protein
MAMTKTKKKIALVLSGGGARGAYQAGVVKALEEIARGQGIAHPFTIITGVSAGSVNASYLASQCHDLQRAATLLTEVWGGLTVDRIFRTNFLRLLMQGIGIGIQFTTGSLFKVKPFKSLLSTTPLRDLLRTYVSFDHIQKNLDAGYLDAVGLTAFNYSNLYCTTFVQSAKKIEPWHRIRRNSDQAVLTVEHVMASASIPIFFPPEKMNGKYYGDGSLRNTAPLSPAIQLGAEKMLFVGVKALLEKIPDPNSDRHTIEPSPARILGILLNAVFFDTIDMDLERLERINTTVTRMEEIEKRVGKSELSSSKEFKSEDAKSHEPQVKLKRLEYLMLTPSQDLGLLATKHIHGLPWTIRFLIRGLGSAEEASELISYLLFHGSYGQAQIDLGYADTMARCDEVIEFLLE